MVLSLGYASIIFAAMNISSSLLLEYNIDNIVPGNFGPGDRATIPLQKWSPRPIISLNFSPPCKVV